MIVEEVVAELKKLEGIQAIVVINNKEGNMYAPIFINLVASLIVLGISLYNAFYR